MANSGSLEVQTDLMPPQSPFPSLLGSGEEGEDDRDRGELPDEDKTGSESGVEVVDVPSSVQPEQSELPFQCLDCGKTFRWSSRLTHHQRSHNNERPYRCNLCPKAFKGSSALLYHQRSHSGEKPYKCQDCGKAFKRSSLLQVHQSVHTGVRTFLCPYCPLTFKWSSHYQYHLRQHTGECPYPCDSCPKAFKNSSSLRRHKNVHLGLKPYTCSVCNKSFTQSTNLRQHMRIHTGERPYVCGKCGRSFTHSSNLALHKNSHTNSSTEAKDAKRADVQKGSSVVEIVVGSEEVTSSMLTDMVGFVSQEGTEGVAVGMEEVFLSSGSTSQNSGLLPQLTLTASGGDVRSSRPIGTEVHLSTDTGASVLLYSCGSCSQTFGTRTELEEHQSIHMAPESASMDTGPTATMVVGEGLVGAGHLLADFEEVVETTTVSDNGQTAEVLLGLTEATDNSSNNVGATQAQFDLLQSLTAVTQSSETVQPEPRTTWAGLSCGYCNKSFKTSGGLNRHVSLMHALSSQSRCQFSCSACDRSFPLLSSLLTHQHSHTPEQRLLAEAEAEIVCPPSLSLSLPLPSSPGQTDKQQEEERGICVDIITVGNDHLEQQSKPLKALKKAGGRSTVAGERPYRCSECGKAFKGSSGLKYHMRDHTGERPYRCTECGKSFKRSSLLSIHQRVHTGVRAFQCPHCPLTFKWSSHYQYHLRQHTGERPYVCKECGKSFKNTSCLRRHSQMHSGLRPHVCPICSKSFSQTSNLKQHERTHSGERPYQCTTCNKSFTHSSNLQLHLRTHSTQKDFKCPFCSKEFVMQSYLQRHIRTHSNTPSVPASSGGAKDGVAVKANVGGVTTTTTLLNPITLETSANNGSLIVSQPALNIPPNSSQNYFMIQTVNGLQLIPLSTPTPTPPPPPPQNYLLLQCPSNNGGQSNLILVPTASPSEPQPLSMLQTIQTLQPVISQTQQFHNPLQQQTLIFTKSKSDAKGIITASPSHTLPPNSLFSRPILGKSTRTARSKRGRKSKAAEQKTEQASLSNSNSATKTTKGTEQPLPSLPHNSISTSNTSPTQAAISVGSSELMDQTKTTASISSSEITAQDHVSGKEFVLCFDNEGLTKDAMDVEGGGDSYMLHFEGEGSSQSIGEEMGTQGKSLLLRFNADQDIDDKKEEKERIMSLLQNWTNEKNSDKEVEGDQREYVLHFHSEDQHTTANDSQFHCEQGNNGLKLTCTSNQGLGSLDRQEVVFELGGDSKIGPEQEERMQMIALIERDEVGDDTRGDAVGQHGEAMEGIFQLSGGQEIVIIEVNTSGIENGQQTAGGGKIANDQCQSIKMDNKDLDSVNEGKRALEDLK